MNESGPTALQEVKLRLDAAIAWLRSTDIDWVRSDDSKRDSTLLDFIDQIGRCVETLKKNDKRFEGVISHLHEMKTHMLMSAGNPKRIEMAATSGSKALDELDRQSGNGI